MDVSGQLCDPSQFTPGTHWIGGWWNTAGLDAVEKVKYPFLYPARNQTS